MNSQDQRCFFPAMTDNKIKLNPRNGWLGWWPRQGIRAILDPENARIRVFLGEQANRLKENTKLLDAGAGSRPYRSLFASQDYQSCDMPGGFYKQAHNFECYLHEIPRPDNEYDAVVLTQVLEHVPDPLQVLQEIQRILRPGGRLLLSVPLNAPLHGEPWHFFHFTHYGIQQLAQQSGFRVTEIEKVGGGLWLIGKNLHTGLLKLFKQYDPFRARKRGQNPLLCVMMNLLLLPLYPLAYLPAAYIIRPLFYWLDFADTEKSFTLGYTAVLEKEA